MKDRHLPMNLQLLQETEALGMANIQNQFEEEQTIIVQKTQKVSEN